jgi:hypothetical protein
MIDMLMKGFGLKAREKAGYLITCGRVSEGLTTKARAIKIPSRSFNERARHLLKNSRFAFFDCGRGIWAIRQWRAGIVLS